MNSIIEHGGIILWVQGVLFFIGLVFIFERLLFFQGNDPQSKDFLLGIKNHLKKGNHLEALHEATRTPGASARIAQAILKHPNASRTHLKMIAQDAEFLEIPALTKHLNGLKGIALLTPLTGLLGTVIGLMTIYSGADLQNPSIPLAMEGLFHSLVTTICGLGISVFIYLSYLWFSGKASRILYQLTHTGIQIIQLLSEYPPTKQENS